MRSKPLKSLHLILSLSKDEAKISAFFSILLDEPAFNRSRLMAEKLIDSKVLGRLIRVPMDAGRFSTARGKFAPQ
jgi:hypothetical protein